MYWSLQSCSWCFVVEGKQAIIGKRKEGTEYSETLGLGLDQFYGIGLGLEAETQMISVSDSVSILRL